MIAVTGLPPPLPNIFTDGTVQHPNKPYFNYGGCGTYHIDRPNAPEDANQHENIAYIDKTDEIDINLITNTHTRVCRTAIGPLPSTTRAESMGALIAIRTPYPVHLALDNKSVVAMIPRS